MITEQHASESAPVVPITDWRRSSPVCDCGQELDVCSGAHCPRCGTTLTRYGATSWTRYAA